MSDGENIDLALGSPIHGIRCGYDWVGDASKGLGGWAECDSLEFIDGEVRKAVEGDFEAVDCGIVGHNVRTVLCEYLGAFRRQGTAILVCPQQVVVIVYRGGRYAGQEQDRE